MTQRQLEISIRNRDTQSLNTDYEIYKGYIVELQKEMNELNEKSKKTNEAINKEHIQSKFDEMMVYKNILAELKKKIDLCSN